MWPLNLFLGYIKNNTISITLNPQYLTCCWLNKTKSKNKNLSIAINAYERTEFKSLEFENSIVFNPTKISSIINSFIKKNKITKPLINIAISGPSVFEQIVTLPTSNPEETDFWLKNTYLINKEININNIKLNYSYLCPTISESINTGFKFYTCAIPQTQLFQYKLLTINNCGKLTLISTEQASLIELYKNINDRKFNQSQLAIDLSVNNYNIKSLFSPEIISAISKIENNLNINIIQESQYLAVSLGLFLLGDKIWKK